MQNTDENIYILMNKPLSYVCSAVSDSHKTVYELLPLEFQSLVKEAKRGHRLHTIGRLDADTSGLLLLTTDGYFSHYITTPSNNIEKTYEATLKNYVSKDEQLEYIKQVKEGLLLPAEKKAIEEEVKDGQLEFLTNNKCLLTIRQGKFHQVRRTFLALGNCVTKLKRLSIGKLKLPQNLKEGEYKIMTYEEISLFNYINKSTL